MIDYLLEASTNKNNNKKILTLLQTHLEELIEIRTAFNQSLLHLTAISNSQLLHSILTLLPLHFSRIAQVEMIHQLDSEGNSTLHYTVFNGDTVTLQLLQSHGGDILTPNESGLTNMHLAAQGGSAIMLVYLLLRYEQINRARIQTNNRRQRATLQEYLNVRDRKGNTPLHWAAYLNQFNATTMLLSLSASTDLLDHEGNTPLHIAVMNNHPKIVKQLLANSAHTSASKAHDLLSVENSHKQTALDIAEEEGLDEIANMLRVECKARDLCLLNMPVRSPMPDSYPLTVVILIFMATFLPPLAILITDLLTYFQSNQLKIINGSILLLGIVTAISYIALRHSQPGTVISHNHLITAPHQNSNNSDLLSWSTDKFNILTNLSNLLHHNPVSSICLTCHSLRPPRSRHCYLCKKCIKVFDHHCPWIGSCIGANNILHYVLCLLLGVIYLIGGVCVLTSCTYAGISAIVIAAGRGGNGNNSMAEGDRLIVAVAAVGIIFAVLTVTPVGYLLVRQLVYAGKGMTTFQVFVEKIKQKEKQNKMRWKHSTEKRNAGVREIQMVERKVGNNNLQALLDGNAERGNNAVMKQNNNNISRDNTSRATHSTNPDKPYPPKQPTYIQNMHSIFFLNSHSPLYN